MSGAVAGAMEAEVRRQAERLREQLAALDREPPLASDTTVLGRVDAAATALRRALGEVPPDLRSLLTAAELGFMPGPNLEAFTPKNFQDWDKDLASLAQGCEAMVQWQGEAGREARRNWLIRGYIRGFAHQWRKAGMGEPDMATEEGGFMAFAARWLHHAGVTENLPGRVRAALGPGWRVAGE